MLCFLLGIFFIGNYSHAQPLNPHKEITTLQTQCQTMQQMLVEEIDRLTEQRQEENTFHLIGNFCKAVKTVDLSCKQIDNQRYDARDSLFLYFLCDTVGESETSHQEKSFFWKNFSKDGYLKIDDIKNLDIIPEKTLWRACNPNKTVMNSCNIHFYAPKILQKIFNEYFNIKQLQIFGIKDITESHKKIANRFSQIHFNNLSICEGNTYRKTCGILQDFIKNIQQTAKNTTILDIKKLSKYTSVDCSNIHRSWYDMLYCSLLGDDINDQTSFNNLLYNELFWYQIFLEYYSVYTKENPVAYLSYRENKLLDTYAKQTVIWKRISHYNNMTKTFKKALPLAIKKLQEIRMTLPLHIGLLMYQEDLANIRVPLGNMYSPIRTLYDKLRNVQDANS